jgi:transposase
MHDYWCSYLDYDCDHVFCHAHHLRDLTFCIGQGKSHWAEEMKAFLLQIKASVDKERQKGACCLSAEDFGHYQYRYWQLIDQGEREHPLPRKQQGCRGRTAKSKARNLLERFMEHGAEMLHFACDFSIPFSNNVAEQALRMMKVKQKISGCFRSREGAQNFARIRSYIDTVRKQGLSILESLKNVIVGQPWLPLVPAPA